MWQPSIFVRNSGEILHPNGGAGVGGFSWYMPNEALGDIPKGLFDTLKARLKPETIKRLADCEAQPPWIIMTQGKKTFFGEFGILSDRLDENGKAHPHARNANRRIPYCYGFVGDLSDPIPSHAEMREMQSGWKDEIGKVINNLNENLERSYKEPDFLRSQAKSLTELMPGGNFPSEKYSKNLWDSSAEKIKGGGTLDLPVIVNSDLLDEGKTLRPYLDRFTIEGLKKKNLIHDISKVGLKAGDPSSQLEIPLRRFPIRWSSLGIGIACVTTFIIASVAVIKMARNHAKAVEDRNTRGSMSR